MPDVASHSRMARLNELGSVVGAQEGRRSVQAYQAREHFDHTARSDAAGHVDREAFPGEFVDHCQALDLLAVGASIEDEVVGPDMVRRLRRQGTRTARGHATPRPAPRQLQSGGFPKAMSSLRPLVPNGAEGGPRGSYPGRTWQIRARNRPGANHRLLVRWRGLSDRDGDRRQVGP